MSLSRRNIMKKVLHKFLVKNLHWTVGVVDLKKHLSPIGEIHSVMIDYDKETGFSKGTGCVYFTQNLNRDLLAERIAIRGEQIEIEEQVES